MIVILLLLGGGGYYYYKNHMKDTEKKEILKKLNTEGKKEAAILVDGDVPVDEDKYHSITVELEKTSKVKIIYSLSTEPKIDKVNQSK